MERADYLVAEIRCELKDESYHVFSNDIPGFHLCAESVEAIKSDLYDALVWFFKYTRGLDINVAPAASPLSVMGGTANDEPKRVVMTRAFAVA